MSGKLLMNEAPLMVQPSLAKKIGLNEAIFLRQLHYWLEKSTKIINKRPWVYNTVEAWQKQFSFWSISTIKRIIARLEKQKLIITDNFNRFSMDRTKWYTINYDELDKLELNKLENKVNSDVNNLNNNVDNNKNDNKSDDITSEENKSFKSYNNKEEYFEKEQNDDTSIVPDCINRKNQFDTTISSSCTDGKCQLEPSNTRDYYRDYYHKNTTTNTKNTKNNVVDVTMKKRIILLATKCGIKANNMRVFFNTYKFTDIERQLQLLENTIRANAKIKNPAGWLRSALDNNYFNTTFNTFDYCTTTEKNSINAEKVKQLNDIQLQALTALV